MAIFDSTYSELLGFIMAVDGEPQDSKPILEKQTIDDLLEKPPAFFGSRKFITVYGLQVRASSYFQLNQPTRCSNFSSLLLVV